MAASTRSCWYRYMEYEICPRYRTHLQLVQLHSTLPRRAMSWAPTPRRQRAGDGTIMLSREEIAPRQILKRARHGGSAATTSAAQDRTLIQLQKRGKNPARNMTASKQPTSR